MIVVFEENINTLQSRVIKHKPTKIQASVQKCAQSPLTTISAVLQIFTMQNYVFQIHKVSVSYSEIH